MTQRMLLGISGSLRTRSLNTAMLRAAAELLPDDTRMTIGEIADIPAYNGDLDVDGGPEPVRRLRAEVAAADGLLIASPEYNHGVPGVLKNAIDWVSRPGYASVFVGKPVLLMGASPGMFGTARAMQHLKELMLAVLAQPMPHRGLILAQANAGKFDADLKLVDAPSREQITRALADFAAYIDKVRA